MLIFVLSFILSQADSVFSSVPRINRSIQTFCESWCWHRIRMARNNSPIQLWIWGTFNHKHDIIPTLNEVVNFFIIVLWWLSIFNVCACCIGWFYNAWNWLGRSNACQDIEQTVEVPPVSSPITPAKLHQLQIYPVEQDCITGYHGVDIYLDVLEFIKIIFCFSIMVLFRNDDHWSTISWIVANHN